MQAMIDVGEVTGDLPDHALRFDVRVTSSNGRTEVQFTGELDLATRAVLHESCTAGHDVVIVDLGRTAFMDCSGYGALESARAMLDGHGGSLTLRNQTGQPLRLLQMIAALDRARGRTTNDDDPG